ncbi:MAG TPA: phosphoenolpyruvate carboxylase [Candidatus Saccharimonadia bacterium]|nr:phosphoenolpyruvate carboxylase [Candidatus Saccharimonadia bacterium]
MRQIPATIASQHPDNALAPYWRSHSPFIGAYHEMQEAVSCFKDLGVSEYMWDWEGKHADAAVIDRLLSDHYDYFSEQQLGRDKFLTFRIPNVWEEKGYNLMQAMSVILSAEDMSRDLKLKQRPLFEVILPMTENADQLMKMQQLFEKLAKFKSSEFTSDQPANNPYMEMIPLVESVESQLGVADLLADYVMLHEKHFKFRPGYIRLFFACSDSSLTSGLLAGILANKLTIIRAYEFQEESGIPVFPFAGPGSLHFRGGLSPHSVDRFLKEYAGVRTVTVQSAFRYDYPLDEVKKAVAKLEKELPKTKIPKLSAAEQKRLITIAEHSAKLYRQTLDGIAGDMQVFFKAVPKRRDRRQHIGLLAYSRGVGSQTLPRAITFTAGFYSIGVPPELLAFGRSLKSLSKDDLGLLQKVYPSMLEDLKIIGGYLNRDNLAGLASRNQAWQAVQEDVEALESLIGLSFAPTSDEQRRHQNLSRQLLVADSADYIDLISKMAVLRKSLG